MNPTILVTHDGEIVGPFSLETLKQEVQAGRISADELGQLDEDSPLRPVKTLLGETLAQVPEAHPSPVWYLAIGPIKHPLSLTATSIGRAPNNDVVLEDLTISSAHAEIVRTDNTYVLRDLGSANGTFVNGSQITDATLSLTDKINFGATSASLLPPIQPTQRLIKSSAPTGEAKADEQPEDTIDDPNRKRKLMLWGLTAFCSWLVVLLIAIHLYSSGSQPQSQTTHHGQTIQRTQLEQPKPLVNPEQEIAALLQRELPIYQQSIFKSIHPVGTAKSLTVHDVSINWKPSTAHTKPEDVLQFTVRYTLYWEGPITTDGYTKLEQTYDTESQRWVNGSILSTNGVTNADTAYLGGFIGGSILREMLQGNQ